METGQGRINKEKARCINRSWLRQVKDRCEGRTKDDNGMARTDSKAGQGRLKKEDKDKTRTDVNTGQGIK